MPDRFPDGLPDEVAEPAYVGSEKSSDTPGSQADLQNAARLPNKPEDWPRVFERHLNAGDLDSVLELYESEARFVAPSGEMSVGRDRIREVIAELVQSKTKLTSRVVKAITLDNTTLLYTDFQGQPSMIREIETIEVRFKAIELVRRQPDGTWKFIVGDPNSRGGDFGERCKATVRSDEVKRWAKDAPTCLQSLIRLDVCGDDAAVGVSEAFDVDFGAESDRSILLLNRRSLGYDNRLLRDHPDPEKSTSGQLLNGSFKFDPRRLICGESREGHSDSHKKCERGQFHSGESSTSGSLAATLLAKDRKSPHNSGVRS